MRTTHQPTVQLPELTPGITLVDVDADLGVAPVQALLLDHVLTRDGPAYWVDGANSANTTRLRELAPADRVLTRIDVARGFTAHQHTSLLDRLAGRLNTEVSPSLVVATGVDSTYRTSDITDDRAEQLFIRAIASIARIARVHDIPVIVTRCRDDEFSRPLRRAATTHLHCRVTPFGPSFKDRTGDTETLVYHTSDGWIQTTLAYWQDVLEHRARMHEASTLERAVGTVGVQ